MYTILYCKGGNFWPLNDIPDATTARKLFRDLIAQWDVEWVQVRDPEGFVVARMSWNVEGA